MASNGLYRRLFWPVYAPSILFGVASGATVPIQVLATMQLGASASLAAFVVAILGAVSLATTVHAGRLIDRIGDRRAMLAATLFASVVQAGSIAALVWGGPGALVLFIATSVLRTPALNVWGLARQAFTAEHVGAHEVGRAMTALGGTMRIGALVGPILGGLLLLRFPLWSVYALSVVCSLAALVVLYLPSLGGRLEARDAAARAKRPEAGSHRDPLDVDWTRVLLAGVALGTLALARTAQPVIVQLWGVHLGLDGSRLSLLVAIGAAVEIVLMFPGGYLKDRLGRALILIICLGIYGSGFLSMVPLSAWLGVAGLAVAIVVMAIGNGLGAGVHMTVGADLSPVAGRARFLGIWALFSNVGSLAGPLLISGLVAVASVASAVVATGAIAVAGAGWVALFGRRLALPRRVTGQAPERS